MKKPVIFFRFGMIDQVLKELDSQPKEFLYGTGELIQTGELTPIFVQKGKRNTLLRKLLYLPEKLMAKTYFLGMPLEIVLENYKKVKSSSVAFCINDAISFALLFCKGIGLINTPVISLMQSLSERHLRYFSGNKLAKKFISFLLKQSDLVLTLSSSSTNELIHSFNLDPAKCGVFYFGTDNTFWHNNESVEKEDFILSVGNDSNRDFNTLIDALADKYKVKIVSRLNFKSHQNVEILNGISNEELRSLYQRARYVITPSRLILTESSGLSTTLQAMACGTPVIASDSLPFREFFKDNESIFLYEPQNPQALIDKVSSISDEDYKRVQAGASQVITNKFNTSNMLRQVKKLTTKYS